MSCVIPALNSDKRQIPAGPIRLDGYLPILTSTNPPNSSLLALDAAKFHRTPTILNYLHSWDIIPSLIPRGCTGLVQPLCNRFTPV